MDTHTDVQQVVMQHVEAISQGHMFHAARIYASVRADMQITPDFEVFMQCLEKNCTPMGWGYFVLP